jgi:hypothetical protein
VNPANGRRTPLDIGYARPRRRWRLLLVLIAAAVLAVAWGMA